MTQSKSQRLWPRLAAEFLVIVVGVLVALAFDSWADRAEDRRRETEALRSLLADISANSTDLRRQNTTQATQADVLDWLLTFPIDGSQEFPLDSIPSVNLAMNVTSAYSPILSTYEALIATGRLDLIEDPEIQLGLSQLQTLSDEYLDYRRQTTDGWLLALKPIWIRWIGDTTGPYGVSLLPPPDMIDALRDREFRGVVRNRSAFLRNSSVGGEGVARHMDQLINLIQVELGDSPG